jgi:hypothetical protein
MAWISVPGLVGKVYVPDGKRQPQKKHPCKTCFSCQWCDETRCRVCRDNPAGTGNNPSANDHPSRGRQTP